MPVPSNFPQSKEGQEHSYEYLNFSDGASAADGQWAAGGAPDGHGTFSYHEGTTSSAPMPKATHPDARIYGTTEVPNSVEKTAGLVQDKFHNE